MPGITCANEMNFSMNHAPGAGSIARQVDQRATTMLQLPPNTTLLMRKKQDLQPKENYSDMGQEYGVVILCQTTFIHYQMQYHSAVIGTNQALPYIMIIPACGTCIQSSCLKVKG